MKKTDEIILVVNRQDIKLENDKMVLTKQPYKMYGITFDKFISFTYSTVENIPDDVLTAHIAIGGSRMILEKIVLKVDQCFFSQIELLYRFEKPKLHSAKFRNNLMNPNYKDLVMRIGYDTRYFIDTPILLDEHEMEKFFVTSTVFQYTTKKTDLEIIITDIMLQIRFWLKDPSEYLAIRRKKYNRKQKIKQILKISRSSSASTSVQWSRCHPAKMKSKLYHIYTKLDKVKLKKK